MREDAARAGGNMVHMAVDMPSGTNLQWEVEAATGPAITGKEAGTAERHWSCFSRKACHPRPPGASSGGCQAGRHWALSEVAPYNTAGVIQRPLQAARPVSV